MSPEVSATIFSTAGPLVPVHCRVVGMKGKPAFCSMSCVAGDGV